jgi:hypothetical protein
MEEDQVASTDPNDVRRSGWSFKQLLDGIINQFRGNAAKQFLVSSGKMPSATGKAPPVLALAAKSRMRDQRPGPYFSRMEEAKRKNQVWNNELFPLVLEKLREQFHEENFKRMRLSPHTSTNVMRRVIEDISILYEQPARRSLEDDKKLEQTDASTKEEDDEAKKVVDEALAEDEADDAAPPSDEEADADKDSKKPDEEGSEDSSDDDDESDDADDVDGEEKPAGGEGEGDEAPVEGEPEVDTGNPEVDALAQHLDVEGANEEEKETPLEQVMKLCDLDVVLDYVEKMTRIHDCVWVMPKVVYDVVNIKEVPNPETGASVPTEDADLTSGKLTYQVFDPSCADVIEDPDNPTKALAWYYCSWELNHRGEPIIVWHFWTKDEYWKFDNEWHPMETEPNELGRLPVTKFKKELETPGSYYVEGVGRDLLEATLEVCVLKTIQNCRFRDSGFKQLALSGADEEDVPADQVMGSPTPLYLGDGGQASVLDLQPMLQEMSEMVKERTDEVADGYGTKFASHKEGGAPQSGFAKKLERDKVLKENKRIRKFFAEGEQDLYNLLAMVLEVYPIEGVPSLDPKGQLTVDYAEPSFEEDPKDQATTDAQNLKLNKTSIVDILKRENPDLNEVELLELAERNRAINAVFLKGDQLKLIDLLATSGTGAGSALAAAQGRPPGAPGSAPPGGGGKPPMPKPGGKPPQFGGAK